ncbi:MAG: hypothetical protein QHI38_08920 [Armatimonadota bacterium]|jgi:hypothetical protein|nr:hypothetical protein [Armatimonadota bacterium]
MRQESFWSACEAITGPATVELEWKQLAGEHYEAAKAFLRPMQELATRYPCMRSYTCGCDHRVVIYSDDDIVAACTCNPRACDTFRLTKSDIIIYELDRPALYRAMAKTLPLDIQVTDIPHLRWTDQIGFYTPQKGFRLPVFLTIQTEPDNFRNTVLDLLARNRESFILMAPTHDLCETDSKELLNNRQTVFLALSDIFRIDESGVFVVDEAYAAVMEALICQSADVQKPDEAQPVCRIPKSVFDQEENYRIIWLHGKKLEALGKKQAEVVRILHDAAKRGRPEMTFASIAVKMTDSPTRMSDVFRYNDSRSVLVKHVKADIYRLNV